MTLFDFDRPIAIQLYGANIDSMVEAAKVAEEAQPDFIDINFGCPMKKIAALFYKLILYSIFILIYLLLKIPVFSNLQH